MPTPDDLDGFILKKEACAAYNRSFRQLGRDLDKAFTKRDESFLGNFRLRIEDGTVLTALEVSKEQIQKLRDKGLNPTWFVREQWMQGKYGLRTGTATGKTVEPPREPVPVVSTDHDAAADSTVVPSATAETLIHSKDELISFLREQNEFLRETLSKELEHSGEERQLTRELHVLLKNMQDRLLPTPDAGPAAVTLEATSQPAPQQSGQTSTAKVVEPRSPKKSAHKKTSKRHAKKASPEEKKADPVKPKWFEMPAIKRFFS